MGPEVQFYLLYNSWNCLGVNALQRLIHKINWPEIHWSCRLSVLLCMYVSLSPSCFLAATLEQAHKHTHTLTPLCSFVFHGIAMSLS